MPHVLYSLMPVVNGQRMLLWSLQRHNPQCTQLVDQLEGDVKFSTHRPLVNQAQCAINIFSDKKY